MDKRVRQFMPEWTIRALWRIFPPVKFTNWSTCQRLLPHVLACTELVKNAEVHIPNTVALLLSAGWYVQRRHANYSTAKKLYQQALDTALWLYPDGHRLVAEAYSFLGTLYDDIGQSDRAEEFLNESLKIYKQLFGDRNMGVAHILHKLASV